MKVIEKASAILGVITAIITFAGFFIKENLLFIIGLSFLAPSVLFFFMYRRSQSKQRMVSLEIEGLSLSSVNLSNVKQNDNGDFILESAIHNFYISNRDLICEFIYKGHCLKTPKASGYAFTFDADRHVPYNEFKCFGFDLKVDEKEKIKIRPQLIGPDGISKKVLFPFTNQISRGEDFHIKVIGEVKDCMSPTKDYVGSKLTLRKRLMPKKYTVNAFTSNLIFKEGAKPQWVRVYDVHQNNPRMLGSPQVAETNNEFWYSKTVLNSHSSQQLIFVFER